MAYSPLNCSNAHQIKTIADYMFDLHDRIANDSSISIYHGKNIQTGCPVAIKAIPSSKNQYKSLIKILNRQIKLSKSLKHRSILKTWQFIQTSHNFYVVSDIYEKTLDNVLTERFRLSDEEIENLLEKICGAVVYLNQNSIIYKTINLSKICITKNDWVLSGYDIQQFLVCSKSELCNPEQNIYVSPEVYYKESPQDIKSNLWSLGICVVQCILGKKSFVGKQYHEIIRLVANPNFISTLITTIFIKRILNGIFKLDPSQRISPEQIMRIFSNSNGKQVLGLQSNKGIASKLDLHLFRKKVSHRVSCIESSKDDEVLYQRYKNKQNLEQNEQQFSTNSQREFKSVLIDNNFDYRSNINIKEELDLFNSESSRQHPIKSLKNIANLLTVEAKIQCPIKMKILRLLLEFFPLDRRIYQKCGIEPIEEEYFQYIIKTGAKWFQCKHYVIFLLEQLISTLMSEVEENDAERKRKNQIIEQVYNFKKAIREKVSGQESERTRKREQLCLSEHDKTYKLPRG